MGEQGPTLCLLGFKSQLRHFLLCDFRQVNQLLCVSSSSPINMGLIILPRKWVAERLDQPIFVKC